CCVGSRPPAAQLVSSWHSKRPWLVTSSAASAPCRPGSLPCQNAAAMDGWRRTCDRNSSGSPRWQRCSCAASKRQLRRLQLLLPTADACEMSWQKLAGRRAPHRMRSRSCSRSCCRPPHPRTSGARSFKRLAD
ncbi:Parp12, partial [Symbiodinium sp. KB8]